MQTSILSSTDTTTGVTTVTEPYDYTSYLYTVVGLVVIAIIFAFVVKRRKPSSKITP